MKKRIISLFTCLTIILSSALYYPIQSEAASARSILNKAYKQMIKYDTVFYYFEMPYKDNGQKAYGESGCSISDTNISHSFASYEQWHIKSRIYSKYSFSTSWTVESTDHDNKSPERYYGKKFFQYCLKNLKSPKIIKSTKSAYVIKGNVPVNKDTYDTVKITINKKNNSVSGMTFHYITYTTTDNNGDEHTITDQEWILTHMCYGRGKLKAPKLLK